MKDEDGLIPTTTAKKETSDSSFFGKGRYKFWALAAILLLAFWSMFTGTVTLRWSAGNLNRFTEDLDNYIHDDLDVLEMEEREKVVKHMWDVYTNSRRIRLPRFWEEAFEAAYEDLTSDVVGVREDAITEIAKMSVRSIDLDPVPVQSTAGPVDLLLSNGSITCSPGWIKALVQSPKININFYNLQTARELRKSLKRAEKGREVVTLKGGHR